MKMVVGLGNWGKQYDLTRHNLGFMVLDDLVRRINLSAIEDLKDAKIYKDESNNLFVYPKLLMNSTGLVVAKLVAQYKLDLSHLLVVRDDIDLPFGKIRGPLNLTGSGGHKGVESIIKALSSNLFYQIKLGLGRPPQGEDVDNFVLGKIPTDKMDEVKMAIGEMVRRIENWLRD